MLRHTPKKLTHPQVIAAALLDLADALLSEETADELVAWRDEWRFRLKTLVRRTPGGADDQE